MDAMSSNLSTAQGPTEKLVDAIENNMMGYFSWIYSSPYSRVEDEPDFLRLTSGIPHPICNCVAKSRFPAEEAGEKIDEMIGFFKSRNLPMMWWVTPCCRPLNLGEHLVSHGFVRELEAVGMTIDLKNLNEDLPVPEDLAIKRVANDSDMQQYLKPFGEGFEFPDFVTTGWGRMDASHGFDGKLPRVNFVATVKGEPASCTALFKTPDSAGIYCVATVPKMRRRGAASALIVNALREARDDGYKIGLLQAKAMGAGVYRKIGFVDQPCPVDWYIWQPPSAAQ